MRQLQNLRVALVAVALVTANTTGARVSAAASSIDDARQLYASADYDQALAALGEARDPLSDQYRALCLFALNRKQDAEAVLQRLIIEAPDFTVSAEDVPPRFVTLVSEVRRQTMPAVLRQLFADARVSFSAKAYDRAMPQFEKVLALSSVPDLQAIEGVSDLRTLTEGFLELIRTTTSATAATQPTAATELPVNVTPVPSAKPPSRTLPVARVKVLPRWPAAAGPIALAPVGAVSIRIDKGGKVVSATMVRRMNASYDPLLLAAVHSWEYAPATLNGQPVEWESVVEIRVSK